MLHYLLYGTPDFIQSMVIDYLAVLWQAALRFINTPPLGAPPAIMCTNQIQTLWMCYNVITTLHKVTL